MYFSFDLENKNSSDCSAPVEPAEVLLARLLDQEIPARLPRVFSGPDSLKLSAAMERGIAILHRQHPDTRSVIFSPGHPEGVLAALAEAIEALHPGLTRRKLRQIPPSGWPGAISRTLMARATVPRHLLVVDPFDELWEPHVGERERGQFLHQLTTMAGLRSTCVLFVLDTRKLEHCQRSRLLQPCLNSRFHLRVGGPPETSRRLPPPVPAPERLLLQPIRPRRTRPGLLHPWAVEAPCPLILGDEARSRSPA